uniref:G-protein coupled receptors family 1 profile domain-containing protein n=1 Tax=Panagrolaimus sp. JU765 TaxID=591449 RepID=A0AC34Q9R4_9BILA
MFWCKKLSGIFNRQFSFFLLFFYFLSGFATKISAEESDDQDEEESEDDQCPLHMLQFIDFKLLFVGCLGTAIALISIMLNLLLFYSFVSSSLLRRRNLTYLTCLSLCDIFIGISYIGIMSLQVYAEYFEILPLYILWHECLNVAFTISNITLTTASFLLVCATFERYLQTIRMGRLVRFVSRHRAMGVFLSFLGGIVFRGSVFFEIQVFYKPECTGFASTGVTLSELVTYPYYDIFRFWIRRISTIFVPFFVLAYCNAMIVYSLQGNQKNKMVKTLILFMTMGHNGEIVQLRSRVRAATRMLIIVVSCYLCANIIDVIIAFLEYTVPEALAQYDGFYTIATDVSSLLSILSSALRPPIYLANDKLIRQEVACKFLNIYYTIRCARKKRAKEKAFLSQKRQQVYEQLEKAASTTAMSGQKNHLTNKQSIDSQTSRIKNGIGSLIIARASVVSGMNDSLAAHYDIEKCKNLYEKSMTKHDSTSNDSLEQSNPKQCLVQRKMTELVPKHEIKSIVRKKVSAPPKLSFNEIVTEISVPDESEEKQQPEDSNNSEKMNPNMVEFGYWYSEV